jgi:hypothetical protein
MLDGTKNSSHCLHFRVSTAPISPGKRAEKQTPQEMSGSDSELEQDRMQSASNRSSSSEQNNAAAEDWVWSDTRDPKREEQDGESRTFMYDQTHFGLPGLTETSAMSPPLHPFNFSPPTKLRDHLDRDTMDTDTPRKKIIDVPEQNSRFLETPPPYVTLKHLPVSLEQLYHGSRLKVRFRRKEFDKESGHIINKETTLDVPVYRGLKPGSRIKFRGEGDYFSGIGGQGSLWFELVEKDHPLFRRQNLDLHTIIELAASEASGEWERTIPSIDGKTVKVCGARLTRSGEKKVFAGLGMPKYAHPDQKENPDQKLLRGDMVVTIEIVDKQADAP